MEATELRLGNKVKCKISNDNGIYHVLGFPDWTNEAIRPVIIDRCPKQTVGIDKLKPILITGDYLEDFGFSCKYPQFRKDDFFIRYEDFRKEYDIHFAEQWLRSIKYIHELQNIYFAITGKEL